MAPVLQETVSLRSLDETLAGTLFIPVVAGPAPALIICHGAGEFKENYFELCGFLARKGIATLAVDMHGHGQSGGKRFHVAMEEWVPDVLAAVEFLAAHPKIDAARIGAFGLSSGGTAILEAALREPRLKSLVALDATVRNSLALPLSLFLKGCVWAGRIKQWFTRRELRVPLLKLGGGMKLASDPEIDQRLQADPRAQEAFNAFPFPGGAEAFFVNTLKKVSAIAAPTLVLWGEDDQIDPPATARMLFEGLTCKKSLHIIPGNGHAGHLDRHREKVFALTADWALENLAPAA
jgi:alpha-beta hydrolase superfamily lysophospholipase